MSPVATPSAAAETRNFGLEAGHGGGAADPLGVALEKSASTIPFAVAAGGAGAALAAVAGSSATAEDISTAR